MKSLSFEITGIAPILMHNERLANPMDQWAKELKKVSSKKQKSDDDHAAMAYIEFMGGIYYREGVYIPLRCIEAVVRDAAKMTKRGKDVQRAIAAVGLDEERASFTYEGPKDLESLYKSNFYDQRTVKVGMARLVRTRPKFNAGWKAQFELAYDEEIFNEDTVVELMDTAGKLVGIGDYRPRYGKFTSKVL